MIALLWSQPPDAPQPEPNRSGRWRPTSTPARAAVVLVVGLLIILGYTAAASAADDPNVDLPKLQPNDRSIQKYCDGAYPGTLGIVFSTGSATTNSQGELTKDEAGYTLTWIEDVGGTSGFDIKVVSVTEQLKTDPLMFSFVVTFLGGDNENGYDYGADPRTDAELNVPGSTGQNITHFGFCAVTTGQIIVEKVTDPATDTTTSFDFTASWDADGFSLVNGEREESARLPEGTYDVTESALAGWDLTDVTCADNEDVTGIDPTAIAIVPGRTVTCTFTNTKRARIVVEKQTLPDGDPATFTFGGAVGGTIGDGGELEALVMPGSHDVSETVPTGWSLTDISCDDDASTEPSSGDTATATATFNVEAGDTVRCVFTNTADGRIEVEKQTLPDDDPAEFTFDGLVAGPLSDNEFDGVDVIPGEYEISEIVPAGWALTDISCDDGASSDPSTVSGETATFKVEPGEAVRCVFTNTADGTITVIKQTLPDGDPATFGFSGAITGTLSDGASASADVAPGQYSVSETVPDGWNLTDITCDDDGSTDPSSGDIGTAAATFNVEPGEEVTCRFTNTRNGKITVRKQTLPISDLTSFTFGGDLSGSIDNSQSLELDVIPGTYSTSEAVPAGWTLTDISCDDDNSTGDTGTATAEFEVEPGEEVTCTFTNTADGRIEVEKQTLPQGDETLFGFSGAFEADIGDDAFASMDVVPGEYTLTESVPDGWALTGIVCNDDNSSGDTATGTATFNVEPGEMVRCVFTNTKDGKITVVKETVPSGSTETFDFRGDITDTLGDGESASVDVAPGSYDVTEDIPAGWSLSEIACDDTNSSGNVDNATAMFSVEAGEEVTCTFTNTQESTIVVRKLTDPNTDPTVFEFTGDLEGAIGHNQTLRKTVAAGTYRATEAVPDGWELTGIRCDDTDSSGDVGTATATFEVDAGETVECTFTNTKNGKIVVEKQTLPDGDTTRFTFGGDLDGLIGDGGTIELDVAPGTYSTTETVPDGWQLTDISCGDTDSSGDVDTATASFQVDAGETVRCVFTNTANGRITVVKETLPDGDPATFEFSGDVIATLSDGGSETVDVAPGTYSVGETVPAGWDLTDITCDDGASADVSSGSIASGTATFKVEPGEDVTCTFTNTKRGMVELSKLVNGIVRTDISWTFTLDGPEVRETTTVPPNPSDFDGAKLLPGRTYILCERGVPVGYGSRWTVDGVDVSAEVYDPEAGDPDASNEDYCLRLRVEPGQTVAVVVDNLIGDGGQRTPGYWKNWNWCSQGNQARTAERNGGVANNFYLLDDVLAITLGDLEVASCEDGRSLLDRRDLNTGRKRASDAAYNLASHLLAAKANVVANASVCSEVLSAIEAADELLSTIGFDGAGRHLRPRDDGYREALELAATLDAYNNGELCV